MGAKLLQSCPFVTPWTVAHQAPLSMGFSRQEYWSGWPCPPPGDLFIPGIEPASRTSPALAGRFCTSRATWEAQILRVTLCKMYIMPQRVTIGMRRKNTPTALIPRLVHRNGCVFVIVIPLIKLGSLCRGGKKHTACKSFPGDPEMLP